MFTRLKALFDMSDWGNKRFGALPDKAMEIRYAWREDEAGLAELFLQSGNVLTETTAAVERGLYLGQDTEGHWKLCVTERTRADYDPREVARGMSRLMDASRYLQSVQQVLGDRRQAE